MAIKDILKAINDELIGAGVLPPSTPVNFGSSPKALRTSPSSIYWVPKTARGMPPVAAVSASVQAAMIAAGQTLQRPLKTRRAILDCHLWSGGQAAADDFSATELLENQVLAAIHHQMYGNYEFIGDEWVLAGTDAAYLGHRLIMRVSLDTPMVDMPATPIATKDSTTIQTVTQTDQFGPIPPGNSTVSSTP